MTFTTFILTYLFGGLTFLPLLIAAIVIPAWLLLPRVDKNDSSDGGQVDAYQDAVAKEQQRESEDIARQREQEQEEKYSPEGAASGSFAVLRGYNFQSAIASLNARSSGSDGGTSTSATGASADGASEIGSATGSESVYQTMYRSVFDRKGKFANGDTSMLAVDGDEPQAGGGEAGTTAAKRKPAPGANVFYIVLRHGHLMLYDTPQQLEVRHVISLAHHRVSLSEGLDDDEEPIIEADLFIKRTAIVLTPTHHFSNGHLQHHNSAPRPFYLFASLCLEKETFYHALLNTTLSPPPVPQMLLPEDAIKLQAALHSTSLTPETRAFNALISRIFLSVHRAPALEALVRRKIEKKISRVQKPAFLAALAVESIDLGDAAPILSNPRLKDLNVSGDLTLAFDVRYTGGIKVVISAAARLDLGSRFKARTFSLLLSTCLSRLSGHVLVRIKPPPSNRIWFSFDSMPDMEIKVEPVVSQRQITYGFVLKAIEDRIRAVVADTLVRPNWDDVPFFDTRAQKLRGGIWEDEGGEIAYEQRLDREPEKRTSAASSLASLEVLAAKNEKTMSMPTLHHPNHDAESSAASSSSEYAVNTKPPPLGREALRNDFKRRSVASTPPTSASSLSPPAKPPRSPSFPSPSPSAPSVALDNNATAHPVRSDDASLQPKKWTHRSEHHAPNRREAVEAIREMRDRAAKNGAASYPGPSTQDSQDLVDDGVIATGLSHEPDQLSATDTEDGQENTRRHSDTSIAPSTTTSVSQASSLRSPRRTDSNRSVSSRGSDATTTSRSQRQGAQQRKTILAATAAATTAARAWGWNAIANRQKGAPIFRGATGSAKQPREADSGPPDSEQPIGRGQPLPPPGTPLPRPQQRRTLWNGAGLGGAGGVVKRKPVLPARRPIEVPSVSLNGQRDDFSSKEDLAVIGNEDDLPGDRDSDSPVQDEMESYAEVEDEFGPWRENSGTFHQMDDMDDIDDLEELHAGGDATEGNPEEHLVCPPEPEETARDPAPYPDEPQAMPKIPPPLPRRRKPVPHAAVPPAAPAAREPEDHTERQHVSAIEQAESSLLREDESMSTDHAEAASAKFASRSTSEEAKADPAAAFSAILLNPSAVQYVTEDDFDNDKKPARLDQEREGDQEGVLSVAPDATVPIRQQPPDRDDGENAAPSPNAPKSAEVDIELGSKPVVEKQVDHERDDLDEELIDLS